MNDGVSRLLFTIGFLLVLSCLPFLPVADASDAFTLIYAGEEGGQLGTARMRHRTGGRDFLDARRLSNPCVKNTAPR